MKQALLKTFIFLLCAMPAHAESVHERVIRTGELRCGYFLEYPLTISNLNTGELEGIIPDVTKTVADEMGLKVVWAEEINASTMIEGLNTGRYDALCAGIMVMTSRAHLMEHSTPLLFAPLYGYVRADDTRFDDDLMTANSSEYTMVGIDGSGKTLMAINSFDKAEVTMLPQFSSFAETFINVADKKADMTFTYPDEFIQYDKHNPGKLKQAGLFSVIPVSFTYRQGEVELKNMFDTAFLTISADGRLDRIIDQWQKHEGSFFRAAKPYEATQ